MVRLYAERYHGFNVRHFHQIVRREHGVMLSYSFVKKALQAAHLVSKRRARGRHRRRREPRPCFGELVHLDGSRHPWLALVPDARPTLIAVVDDATKRLLYAQVVEEGESAEGGSDDEDSAGPRGDRDRLDGPAGQLQRSVMNDQSAPLPFGFLRRRVAEYEREKVEEYLAGLRDLLEQYRLPTAGKVQDFMNKAPASGPDSSGLFEMTGHNVVAPGDTFSLWVDPRTRHAQKVQVSAAFQGDPVNLTATFKTLPRGSTAWPMAR